MVDLKQLSCKRCHNRAELSSMKYDLDGRGLICPSCYEEVFVKPKKEEAVRRQLAKSPGRDILTDVRESRPAHLRPGREMTERTAIISVPAGRIEVPKAVVVKAEERHATVEKGRQLLSADPNKVKYICGHCRYKFSLRADSMVQKKCPYCGTSKVMKDEVQLGRMLQEAGEESKWRF